MSVNSKLLGLLCVVLFVKCTKEINLPYPDYEAKVILTGILNPDSMISVQLLKTLPALSTETIYPAITNAKVLCYENNKLLGELKNGENGYYRLNLRPQSAKKYRIEATINDLIVSAEDSIPLPVVYDLTITAPVKDERNNNNPEVIFNRAATTTPVYTWLFIGLNYKRSLGVYEPLVTQFGTTSFASTSPYLDTFNSFLNFNGKKAFSGNATRIKPEFNQNIQFSFSPNNTLLRDSTLYVQVSTVSKNYDTYLKSSINAYQTRLTNRDGEINNPFSEPVKIYSNVKNGVGIFGAMRTQRFLLKNTKR